MDKEVCFFINGNTLFLDKVLVAFNDTPIFFVCYDDDNNYYIALCTDIEELEYIIVKCSLQSLYQMLVKKIEMREPFVTASHFWYVKAGTSVENDEVQYLEREHMDLGVLPYPNAFYETRNEKDREYVEKIEAIYCVKENFSAIETIGNLEEIVNAMMEISLDFIPQSAQYFDFAPASTSPFVGRTKKFEFSDREHKTFLYTEHMEGDANTSVDYNFIKDLSDSNICVAA